MMDEQIRTILDFVGIYRNFMDFRACPRRGGTTTSVEGEIDHGRSPQGRNFQVGFFGH